MKDFFENKNDNKKMLEWCQNNLFCDARDYISRRSVVDYSEKSDLDVFLSLSITTWMLIVNEKINEEDLPLLKKEGKEESIRSIMLFLLKTAQNKK
jgi:hypothetical protein